MSQNSNRLNDSQSKAENSAGQGSTKNKAENSADQGSTKNNTQDANNENRATNGINLDYDWNTEYGDGDIPDVDK